MNDNLKLKKHNSGADTGIPVGGELDRDSFLMVRYWMCAENCVSVGSSPRELDRFVPEVVVEQTNPKCKCKMSINVNVRVFSAPPIHKPDRQGITTVHNPPSRLSDGTGSSYRLTYIQHIKANRPSRNFTWNAEPSEFLLDVISIIDCRLLVVIHSVAVSAGLLKKPVVTIKHVGAHNIAISITPPVDAPPSEVITYMILFGKAHESRFKDTNETSVTLNKLRDNTEYEIKARARLAKDARRGKYGPMSDALKVTTGQGSRLYGVIHRLI